MFKRILAAVILLASTPTPAKEKPLIIELSESYRLGGEADVFLDLIKEAKADGTKYVIKKSCVSACTLFTKLIEDGLVCATPGTKFVFHRFMWGEISVVNGREEIIKVKFLPSLNERYWNQYPKHVRLAVLQRSPSGLPPWGKELKISAHELRVPTCP